MKERIGVGVCVLMMVIGFSCFGLAGSEGLSLSMADAVRVGLENNPDIHLARIAVDDAATALQRQRIVGDETAMENASETLIRNQDALALAEENLIFDVERRYYDLLKTIDRVQTQSETLQESERNLALDEARFQAGLISEQSLLRTRNSLASSQISFHNQLETLQTQWYRFNELLGLSLHTKIMLADVADLTYRPVAMDFDEALAAAMAHSDALKRAEETLEVAIDAVKQADNDFTAAADLEKAIRQRQEAEINLGKAQNRVFFDTRSAYLNLQQRQATVSLRKADVDFAARNLQIVRARVESGAGSADDLTSAERSLVDAQTDLNDAIWDHLAARRDLFRLLGLPTGIREEAGNEH